MVGGSALPGGVMMRTRNRVGVAVRREEDGAIVTEGFDLEAPTARWTRLPLMRGVVAIRTALSTGQKSMAIGERLRWEEPRAAASRNGSAAAADEDEQQGLGFWGKVAVGVGALLGAGLQIALFRIGPVVIAKEAGLTGAAFIIADAAIRLVLLLGMLKLLSFLRPFRKILKYHGAEHQAIAAHEAGAPLMAGAAARLLALPSALRDVLPGGLGRRVDRRLRRRTGDHRRLHLPRADRHPPHRRADRHRHRLRAAAPGGAAVGRPLALPLVARHVGPAPDDRPARPRASSRWPAPRSPSRSSSPRPRAAAPSRPEDADPALDPAPPLGAPQPSV